MIPNKDSKNLAFLLYAQDFLVDTQTWTPEEVGIYIRLLCLQWVNGSINADPNRLANGVGNGVLSCWETLKPKFVLTQNGDLINLRLEKERQKVHNYIDNQSSAGKKGAEKRWGRHSEPTNNPNGGGNGDLYANTNTNTIYNNIKGNEPFDENSRNSNPNGDPILENKKINLKENFFAAAEKSIQIGQNRRLRLHLYLDGGYTSKEIEKLLGQNLERMVMTNDLYKRDDDFLTYLFETYFREIVASGQETSSGKINKDFIFWLNNSMKRIDKAYNDSKKNVDWFTAELEKTNGICKKEDQRNKFKEYYLTPTPSGKLYFQTLQNFDVKESLQRWVDKDYKTVTKLAGVPAGTTVLPGDGHTIDEIKNFYKQE